ncbi:hypothetical protein HRbin28_00005 [bacterium HR28]|nr:hypothetical protein HRbin28_00005 [bacterium HR28]
MSARLHGGFVPAAKRTEHTLSPARGKDTTLDRLVERAARELLPSPLTEAGWLRRSHADIRSLEAWELRREIRVIASYLDTAAAQRDFNRAWFEERLQRLRAELARRQNGGAR